MNRTLAVLIGNTLATIVSASVAWAGPPLPNIPDYKAKPATWRTMLIDKDQRGVFDDDFATWVKAAQTAAGQQNPARQFEFIATFSQCHGGGFLTELKNKNVTKFGANSASRYYEPSTYDVTNNRSYYAHAWWFFLNAANADKDKLITQKASNALVNGMQVGVPANPDAAEEHVQYLDDDNNAATPPPQKLHNDTNHNYAIIWVGLPEPMDQTDVTSIFDELKNNLGYAYNIAAANLEDNDIYILWGNGNDPNAGDGWKPTKAATKANLQAVFAAWLIGKLAAQGNNTTAQVFFWAGDHGTADAPIGISVDMNSKGKLGTAVRAEQGTHEIAAFEAGKSTNTLVWKAQAWPVGNGDIDAMSLGDDTTNLGGMQTPGGLSLYFSVDKGSQGLNNTAVKVERTANRSPAPDVFVRTAGPNAQTGSNRQVFDGDRNLGLEEPAANEDDVDALIMRNISALKKPMNELSKPLFYSIRGSSIIYVYDPRMAAAQRTYVYLNFGMGGPAELDALALVDDFKRRPMDYIPVQDRNKLFFDLAMDRMLFSIGPNDANLPFKACDILSLGAGAGVGLYLNCAQMGLAQATDNIDALDVGQGIENEPGNIGCGGDTDNDDDVDIDDLLSVITQWGPCEYCSADLAPPGGNGQVNIDDLLAIINGWGLCPPRLGACCLPTGSCQNNMSANACQSAGGVYQGNDSICFGTNCPVPPPNDLCQGAINVTVGGSIVFSNADSSLDGPAVPLACTDSISRDVWFNLVGPCNGSITINSEGTPPPFVDTVIAVYDGGCDPLGALIGCDDDSGTNLLSSVTIPVLAGQSLKIRFMSYGSAPTNQGGAQMNIFINNCN